MIYISLTTVPERLAHWESFEQNLYSLVNQRTVRDYKVVLNIPKKRREGAAEERYVFPGGFSDFLYKYPNLLLHFVEQDSGPLTKILGTLELSLAPEDTIIVCDDDHYYHEDMLEYHLSQREKYPEDVIAFRGDRPIRRCRWQTPEGVKEVLLSRHTYFPVMADTEITIPGHWHSVSYLRRFFEEDFFEEKILTASEGDDIVMGYYLRLKNRRVMCVRWDQETDWRPVNDYGRPAYTFPIITSLPYPDSGFNEFRKKAGNHLGEIKQYALDVIHRIGQVSLVSNE